MKKRYIVIPLTAFAVLGIGATAIIQNDNVKVKDDKVIIETTNAVETTVEVTTTNNIPVIYGKGTKDRTLYLEDKIDLLKNVKAKDEEDGNLTDKITVNDVDIKTIGKKEVIFTVTDSSGNETTKTVNIKIKSKIKKLNKTMYANTAVNVRKKWTADSKKVNSLSYAQSVHVTGKVKGRNWYRVKINGKVGYVKADYLTDTKPVVYTPSSSSSSSSKNTGSSYSKNNGSSSSKNNGSSSSKKNGSGSNKGSGGSSSGNKGGGPSLDDWEGIENDPKW